jgi:3-isopropylmalate dehydrogenase
MGKKILVISGDGIGPEITVEARKVLQVLDEQFELDLEFDEALMGGAAIDATGVPLPDETLAKARACDAILFAAIGGPKWDKLDRAIRPEKGLLKLRSELGLFGNLRPAILYPQLADASSLKPEIVAGLDILIVRELTGFNTDKYSESEVRRVGRLAFELARKRGKKVCSVDKSNVLESTILWREVMEEVGKDYPDVELSHMYVDNASMQLVRAPKQFDVIVTGNLFGDILSDEAAMLTGSIGMLPSASLNEKGAGMYEPCHGSAPDIAGQGKANPLAMFLSTAMMLRYSLGAPAAADAIERAIGQVLDAGLRTPDIHTPGTQLVNTSQMGDAVVKALRG